MIVQSGDTKDKSIRRCGMCGTKEGEERPVGKIIVELRSSVYEGEQDFLCQTCFLLNKSEVSRKEGNLNEKKKLKWYQKLLKIGFISRRSNE